MLRKFFQNIGRCIVGLAVALTACAPVQTTLVPAIEAPWTIMANQSWQPAYQFVHLVHPGDQLEIVATGTWSHDPTDPQFSSSYAPTGVDVFDPAAILPSAPLGSLVGRIGDNPPFVIGEHLVMTSAYRGELWVSMNDSPDRFSDNTGFVGVSVKLTPKPPVSGIPLTNIAEHYRLVYPQGYYVAITDKGICLTQNPKPSAEGCDLPNVATLEVGDAKGQTAAQLVDEMVLVDDPNLRFDSHDMLVDGEQAIWISREGGDGVAQMVMIAHGGYFYLWSFTSLYPVPDVNVAREIEQVQKLYDTVINSFEFLD